MKNFILYLGVVLFTASVIFAAFGDLELAADGTKVIWPSGEHGIIMDIGSTSVWIGEFPDGTLTGRATIVGQDAGSNLISVHTAIGYQAGKLNTGFPNVHIASEAGLKNTGQENTAVGFRACMENDSDRATAIGDGSFNSFVKWTAAAKVVTSVDHANNQITIVPTPFFCGVGEFINLKMTSTGDMPAGLSSDATELWECKTINI